MVKIMFFGGIDQQGFTIRKYPQDEAEIKSKDFLIERSEAIWLPGSYIETM
jgi:hypothetical protein